MYQLTKRCLASVAGVGAKQDLVVFLCHLQTIHRRRGNRTPFGKIRKPGAKMLLKCGPIKVAVTSVGDAFPGSSATTPQGGRARGRELTAILWVRRAGARLFL